MAQLVAPTTAAAGIVVLGASAGGVEALRSVAGALPHTLPWAVLVVLHLAPDRASVLPRILARTTRLPVLAASSGALPLPGHVHVAPPDHHLLVGGGRLWLARTPPVHGVRPAIDPTLRSVARAYGPRALGAVLSGTLHDGTDGLRRLKAAGGTVAVQDPADARYDAMPRSAMRGLELDAVLPADALGRWIGERCALAQPVAGAPEPG